MSIKKKSIAYAALCLLYSAKISSFTASSKNTSEKTSSMALFYAYRSCKKVCVACFGTNAPTEQLVRERKVIFFDIRTQNYYCVKDGTRGWLMRTINKQAIPSTAQIVHCSIG